MSYSGLLSYFEDIVSANPEIKLPEPEQLNEDMEKRKRKKVKKTVNKYSF